MNSRELVEKTLNFNSPARIPRQCWLLPWAEMTYPAEAANLAAAYPDDIMPVAGIYTKQPGISGNRYKTGTYIDEWGCIFNNIHEGLIGVPSEPLIKDWEQLTDFTTPDEVLYPDYGKVKELCRNSGKFTYSSSWIRPFERYQFIRTIQLAMTDFAIGGSGMETLIGKIHSHYLKETEAWAKSEVDAIGIMDDWGMQSGMIVEPAFFRQYFKPLYMQYTEIAKHYGKYVFMHSDGNISEIIPDLIETGIDAINSQLFCMNIEELGSKFRGKITFWGEIDRQNLLPNGTRKEVEAAVNRVFKNLYSAGGIIGQCEFGPGAKPENVFHVFESWNKIKPT